MKSLLYKKIIPIFIIGFFLLLLLFLKLHYGKDRKGEIFGMRIEQMIADEKKITIVTTGAKFLLYNNGTLESWQRIPEEREVAKLTLPLEVWPFKIIQKDDFTYLLSGKGIDLIFSGDSLLIIKINKNLSLDFQGLFKPEYNAEKDGKWLFIDSFGGFGIYPVEKKQAKKLEFSALPWNINYDFLAGEEIWFSVFPPRLYNWNSVFRQIAHTGGQEIPYPSNELIRSAAQYAKIFLVHSYIWPGGDHEPWLIPAFVPSNMEEFMRVRDEVHRNGMKFLVYASPYYSTSPDFFAEIKKVLNEYKVDGLYFDGISFDFRKSYYTVREARKILGDNRILFIHSSTDPFSSVNIYAPFIDTYADYILRGEAGRPGNMELKDFLRWTISGYNISNTIGYWIYFGSAEVGQQGYIYRIPKKENIDIALENNVYLAWSDGLYGENSEDLERFRKEYYEKLKLIKQKYGL